MTVPQSIEVTCYSCEQPFTVTKADVDKNVPIFRGDIKTTVERMVKCKNCNKNNMVDVPKAWVK